MLRRVHVSTIRYIRVYIHHFLNINSIIAIHIIYLEFRILDILYLEQLIIVIIFILFTIYYILMFDSNFKLNTRKIKSLVCGVIVKIETNQIFYRLLASQFCIDVFFLYLNSMNTFYDEF